MAANVDESIADNEKPVQAVERLAELKAKEVVASYPEAIVLGSDTVIGLNNNILGKPRDEAHFNEMMMLLSNRWHEVYTGVCIVHNGNAKTIVVSTRVKMTHISQNDVLSYWRSGEPQDKAGGYAIQGIGGQFIERIDGSYSSVVGLPLCETKQLINEYL